MIIETRKIRNCLILLAVLLLAGCVPPPPKSVTNVCKIFRQYPKWYWATRDARSRWGTPISIQMAFIHQESRFNGRAKPGRRKLLWIIPWKRKSTSYGYSQSKSSTWRVYKRDTGRGTADRDRFSDAVDFIGWYTNRAHRKLKIARTDAFRLYLAYHEGLGGYERGTYRRKPWLVKVSRKVALRAATYRSQLQRCEKYLKRKPWWRIW
jgi:hypothetical protein